LFLWFFVSLTITTIYSNGWNNVSQCPLLNVMFTCPNGKAFVGAIDTIRQHIRIPSTYVMHWLDTLKVLEWKHCTNLYRQCFEHVEYNWPFNLLFSKYLLSKLCYSFFRFTIKILGQKNMGKTNFAHEIVIFYG